MLIVPLIGSPKNSLAQTNDFVQIPSGTLVVFPEGDSLLATIDYRLVSDSAIIRMDLALRTARQERDHAKEDASDWQEISQLRSRQVDSLSIALNLTSTLLGSRPNWLETIENFGLAAGGFTVCRALDPR